MKLYNLFLLILFSQSLVAQDIVLSGKISDASNGESLIGATIRVVEKPTLGSVTNTYGFYSLKLPAGNYSFLVKYLGYEDMTFELELTEDTKKNIELTPKTKNIKDVVISAKKQSDNVQSTNMGTVQVDLAELTKIPVILGERDVLKSIQLLPGVMPAQEGTAGFVVRGGNTDQNMILLDEAPVYNASHMLGFFSTFNSDALKDMTLYKGNMPAEYGGRLSSVVDVKMKDGNNKNFEMGGGLGLIASRLYVEAPIVKDKSSFFVAGRRTYADIFLGLSKDEAVKQSTLYFYDLNAKMNFTLGQKDKLYLSGYFGNDYFKFGNFFGIRYGNVTSTLRWNHLINDKLFSNTSLIYNNFNYRFTIDVNSFDLYVTSILNDYSLKQDFDYYLNTKNRMKFGFLTTWHNVVPGDITSSDTTIARNSLSKSNGWESNVYFQNEQIISSKVTLNYGLRLSMFSVMGTNTLYNFNDNGEIVDTTYLKSFQFGKTYVNPEPRISARIAINDNNSIKMAYSRNVQNIQQLTNTTSSSPTDRWVLTSNNIKPGLSDQASVGYFFNFLDGQFEASVETYFKWLQNQVDYKNGAVLRANETVEKDLVYGVGRAYGLEVFLKKKTGKLTGWISYTLSKSQRSFDQIMNGEWFNSRYDRTHDLNLVAMWDISKKINISGVFVFYTGNAVTFPSGKYNINGNLNSQNIYNQGLVYNSYSDRNSDRMPSYNRLDFSFNWLLGKSPRWETSLNFSIYNVLGTKNAYQMQFKYDAPSNSSYVEKTYLFAQVPSVTFNFKFNNVKK